MTVLDSRFALQLFVLAVLVIPAAGVVVTIVLKIAAAHKAERGTLWTAINHLKLDVARCVTTKELETLESDLKGYLSERFREHEKYEDQIHQRLGEKLDNIQRTLNGGTKR